MYGSALVISPPKKRKRMTHRTVSCQYRDCHTLDKPKNMENPTEKRMQNEKWKVYLEPFGGCNIGDESQEFGNSNSSN